MGFLGSLISGTIKVALTPIAIVTDVIEVVNDNEPDTTQNLLKSALDDIETSVDDLTKGDIL